MPYRRAFSLLDLLVNSFIPHYSQKRALQKMLFCFHLRKIKMTTHRYNICACVWECMSVLCCVPITILLLYSVYQKNYLLIFVKCSGLCHKNTKTPNCIWLNFCMQTGLMYEQKSQSSKFNMMSNQYVPIIPTFTIKSKAITLKLWLPKRNMVNMNIQTFYTFYICVCVFYAMLSLLHVVHFQFFVWCKHPLEAYDSSWMQWFLLPISGFVAW